MAAVRLWRARGRLRAERSRLQAPPRRRAQAMSDSWRRATQLLESRKAGASLCWRATWCGKRLGVDSSADGCELLARCLARALPSTRAQSCGAPSNLPSHLPSRNVVSISRAGPRAARATARLTSPLLSLALNQVRGASGWRDEAAQRAAAFLPVIGRPPKKSAQHGAPRPGAPRPGAAAAARRAEAGSGGRGPARRGRERRPRPASAAGAGQTASATLPASKGATPPSSRGGRVRCEAADGDCGWDCPRPPALRRATLCMRAPTVPHNCDTAKVWTRVREHVLQGVGHKGM